MMWEEASMRRCRVRSCCSRRTVKRRLPAGDRTQGRHPHDTCRGCARACTSPPMPQHVVGYSVHEESLPASAAGILPGTPPTARYKPRARLRWLDETEVERRRVGAITHSSPMMAAAAGAGAEASELWPFDRDGTP